MSKITDKQNSKRSSILDAAYELFTSKSFSSTTIDDVVRKAGIAKGTFYLYFKDKYDLMDRIVAHKSLAVLSDAMNKLKDKKLNSEREMSFSAQMLFIVNCIVDYMQSHRELIVLVDKKLSKGIGMLSSMTDEKLRGEVDNVIDEAVKGGSTREETVQKIYLIIDLIGSVCSDAIIYEKPFKLDEIKPVLFSTVEKILA